MSGHEDGISFPELLVAALLIGLVLIPLLQIYPRTLGYNVSKLDTILSAAAIRKAEELTALMRVRGASPPANGSAACSDIPNCLLVWTITTELSSAVPGVGWLADVTVVACQDQDRNNICDAGEPQVRYDGKGTSRP